MIFLEKENLQNIKYFFFDFGLSSSNYKKISSNSAFLFGASCFHLNKPKQSLVSNDQVYLKIKYILYSVYYTNFNSKISMFPAFYFSLQNQQKEYIIGSDISYKLTDYLSLKSGVYSRVGDAVIVFFGMKKYSLEATFSYDINTSKLAKASSFMGGLEISIGYGWSITNSKKSSNNKICPKYL